MPIPPEVIETVSIENLKTVAGFSASMSNVMLANSVSNQQTVNGIMAAALGKIVKELTETDVSEAAGLSTILQQAVKAAGNTPPVTP